METIDDEISTHALRFIEDAHRAHKPFFLWWNSTHMHFRTHVKKEFVGRSGQGFYNDTMMYHDSTVGTMLQKLDELKIAEDTIVIHRPTMDRISTRGPTRGSRRFEARRIRIGRVAGGCLRSRAGRASTRQARR